MPLPLPLLSINSQWQYKILKMKNTPWTNLHCVHNTVVNAKLLKQPKTHLLLHLSLIWMSLVELPQPSFSPSQVTLILPHLSKLCRYVPHKRCVNQSWRYRQQRDKQMDQTTYWVCRASNKKNISWLMHAAFLLQKLPIPLHWQLYLTGWHSDLWLIGII